MSSLIFETTTLKCIFCRAAEPNVFQKCRKNILRDQRKQTALKKPDKARATTQSMVLGTVSATDIMAQPLRLNYITTKPLRQPVFDATLLKEPATPYQAGNQ